MQLNIQSLKPKPPELRQVLTDTHQFDVVTLSEIWLRTLVPARLLNIDGYKLYRRDRSVNTNGRLPKGFGGVAVVARDTSDVTVLETPNTAIGSSNLEIALTLIRPDKAKAKRIIFGSLYRHPTDTVQQVSDDLDDLENQLQLHDICA